LATTNYKENMKRTLTIVILLFCFIGVNAQRLGKINERLENLEKNRKIDKTIIDINLSGKKFVWVKNINKVVYKNVINFADDNKITLIELTDDKQTDAKTSKLYTGDAIKRDYHISVRADKLEGKILDLPYTINFILQKREGVLCLVNISNNDVWIDIDSSKKY
jgi:hypothetical protein